MKPIIKSILDTDLYKLTQQYFVLQNYPEIEVVYTFINRDKSMKFNDLSINEIKKQVEYMSNLRLLDDEYDWIKKNLYFLPITYLQYLSAYRFNPQQLDISLNESGDLSININGKWRDTILWEVPLMSIISEVYFYYIDKDWSMDNQDIIINKKSRNLSENGCLFADFGSRRRRNYETQELVVNIMKDYKGFVGTSNPYLAYKFGVKALGTCAHESIGAVAALDSLNHPNKLFMEKWANTYQGSLGIMLTDTYGTDSFLKDFSLDKAKLWDGVRHDSGDPFIFIDKIIKHYKNLGIDPLTKTIIFSNNLDDLKSLDIYNYCKGKIKSSFGIGTFFTSDFMKISDKQLKSKPMNIVIKLIKAGDVDVVKLSDSPDKATGDSKMIDIMKYIHIKN